MRRMIRDAMIQNPKPKIKNRSGVSLFEVILAIGIASLLVLVAVRFGAILSGFGTAIGNQTQAGQEAILGIQTLTSDIRTMTISAVGAYPIDSATTSSITFYSDVNQDGIVDRVRYFLGTSTLQRGIVTPSGNPLVYVTSSEIITTAIKRVVVSQSIFDYFDSGYTGLGIPLSSPINTPSIHVVRPTMVMMVGSATSSKTTPFVQTITIRNLRSN